MQLADASNSCTYSVVVVDDAGTDIDKVLDGETAAGGNTTVGTLGDSNADICGDDALRLSWDCHRLCTVVVVKQNE